LAAQRGEWDLLELPQLPERSPWLALAWPAGWRREVAEEGAHPVLPLPAPRPAGLARSIAASRRRAQRLGRFEVVHAQPHTAGALLDALARLHAQRWAREGLPGVLGAPGVLEAHRDAVPQLLAEGVLRLFALQLDGQPLAVLYGLADAPRAAVPRWCYYIGGFDPAFAALSPGSLAVAQAIDLAQDEGAAVFDFLRGAEPYKYRWGARDEPRFTLRVTPA
jgi:CelD/BcsL family acetyltransferase involved in cellulose biosynthesis